MKLKQRGFALPISLLLLVVMTLMGATLVGITTSEVRDNDEKDKSQQTFYAAESGISHAKRWMRSNISTLNQGPQVNLNKNLNWCTPDFLPNFNGNKGFTTNRKTMSEMISGTEPGETSRLKSFSFEYFIAYAPDKNGNSSSAIKKPGTNKTYYTIYSCGCDTRKILCKNNKNKIVSLEATVTISSQ